MMCQQTQLDTRRCLPNNEMGQLMGSILDHAERVEGRIFKPEEINIIKRPRLRDIPGGLTWEWRATIGKSSTHWAYGSGEKYILEALLGVLGSMPSHNE